MQCNQIDVLKISDVPFPNSGCCSINHFAAAASAPMESDIPEFTVCYRMLIDSYNDELFIPFGAVDGNGKIWYILDRMCWKCGRGSEGYQGGLLYLTRNIPGGGLVNKGLPIYHQYNMARDIAISKWTHICFSYSTINHNVHLYQDGIKVFNFTYGDEKEDPLSSSFFEHIRIGANMRGLLTDVQVYNKYFNEDKIISWTTSCPGSEGEIFNWDRTKLNTKETIGKNVTFVTMDSSEVCPDPGKLVTMQQPRISASGTDRRRFQPPPRNRTSYASDVLEYITGADAKTFSDVEDRCFRMNGELFTLPQNKVDEDIMNEVLWTYLMKKTSNDEKRVYEHTSIPTPVAARTGTGKFSDNSRQQTYPPKGKIDLFHPWTGEALHDYRGDLIWPQTGTYYKYPQLCFLCFGQRKKPLEDFWNNRTKSICAQEQCTTLRFEPYICVFTDEPALTVRGLCKDAVMDTQYKFADHEKFADDLEQVGWTYWYEEYREFVGPKGWIISRNRKDLKWRMTHYYYTELSLIMLDSDALPVGRHKWLVENNVCKEGETSTEILQLSSCAEEQFTCDDGKCLQMSQRCNNIEVGT